MTQDKSQIDRLLQDFSVVQKMPVETENLDGFIKRVLGEDEGACCPSCEEGKSCEGDE